MGEILVIKQKNLWGQRQLEKPSETDQEKP